MATTGSGSKSAQRVAAEFAEMAGGDREAVWLGDGGHKGTTVFRSRRHSGFHAYDHEGQEFHENIDGLTLVEGDGSDGDETGMNQHPGLLGVDFDGQYGLWLIGTSENIGELPAGHTVVWTSNPV